MKHWKELPYDKPHKLSLAWQLGKKFVLHYHGREIPVERMRCANSVVYCYPLEVKVYPNGKSAEGPGEGIWLEAV